MNKRAKVITGMIFVCSALALGATDAPLTVVGSDDMRIVVLREDVPLFIFEPNLRGPGWNPPRRDRDARPRAEGSVRVFEDEIGFLQGWWDKQPMPGVFDLRQEMEKKGPRTIVVTYNFTPKDVPMTFGIPKGEDEPSAGFGPRLPGQPYFNGGQLIIKKADGGTETTALPPPLPKWSREDIAAVTLRTREGEEVRMVFEPPTFLHCDIGEVRFMLGRKEPVKPGETLTAVVSITLLAETDFEPENRWVNTSDWLVFDHVQANDFSAGTVLGMEDWLERPAGKRGRIRIEGDRLVGPDGKPVKLYGTGISWNGFLKPKIEAGRWADKFAKHGINVVRLIPMMGHGHQGLMSEKDHLEFVPEKLAQFDDMHVAMKERGVYLGWSPQYHLFLTPADRDRVLDYDELTKGAPNGDVTYSVFDLAPDLQDLMIRQTLALVNHRNPHTGLRYAEDPAIAWIELRNENDIFFNPDNFGRVEQQFPGYFKRFQERFGDYLQKKYQTQEALGKAWKGCYPEGRTLAARDIRPSYEHWAMPGGKANPHQADTMHFMYLEQKRFYDRYAKALRDAGYDGMLNGSCWQAFCWLGHLWNVLSDSELGIVDRHNYNVTLLNDPGVGNMSASFQQVKGRPFNLSEWGGGTVAVPVVAAYGMGLQGFDISCQYASGTPGILNRRARDVNNNSDDFVQIAQHTALARMLYRGDLKEGEIAGNRLISIEGLKAGDVGINETFSLMGGANNKSFSSVIPSAAIMAGRVLLEFVEGPVPAQPVVANFADWIDEHNRIIRASNGQLEWHYGGHGYFTINAPGTQAAIGWIHDQPIDLDDIAIRSSQKTEMKLYVSGLGPNDTLAKGRRFLITALGRDADTGMVMDEFHDQSGFLLKGREPLLIEPIEATITIKGRQVKSVLPLDHGGRLRNGATSLKVRNDKQGATFTIDGKASRTMYYLVETK